jgi:hypothetical protein
MDGVVLSGDEGGGIVVFVERAESKRMRDSDISRSFAIRSTDTAPHCASRPDVFRQNTPKGKAWYNVGSIVAVLTISWQLRLVPHEDKQFTHIVGDAQTIRSGRALYLEYIVDSKTFLDQPVPSDGEFIPPAIRRLVSQPMADVLDMWHGVVDAIEFGTLHILLAVPYIPGISQRKRHGIRNWPNVKAIQRAALDHSSQLVQHDTAPGLDLSGVFKLKFRPHALVRFLRGSKHLKRLDTVAIAADDLCKASYPDIFDEIKTKKCAWPAKSFLARCRILFDFTSMLMMRHEYGHASLAAGDHVFCLQIVF